MANGMRSQVFYHEWSPKGGRVLFADGALEVRFSRFDPNTWLSGVWATKVIPYDTIQAGFAVDKFIRVVFDDDDEIMFHRRVFEQCTSGVPPFVILVESFEVCEMWAAVEAMRARQRVLPPVSWAEGRHSVSPRTWRSVRVAHMIPPVVGVGLVVWSLVR